MVSGDTNEALKYYTQCIENFGPSHAWFANRSAAYLMIGDTTKALEDAIRCIELDSNFLEGYQRKGAALFAMQNYESAIATYEEGIEKFPDADVLVTGLAQSREEKQKLEKIQRQV